jgi:ketosteroid isomerase-like protein
VQLWLCIMPTSISAGPPSPLPDPVPPPLAAALAYLEAVAAGATGEALARFLAPDIEQIELPNRLVAGGARHDLSAMLAGAERGQRAVTGQRYDVVHAMVCGDRVALEVAWSATLRVPLGTLTPGDTLRAHLALFLEIEGGRVVRQRNYDCYEPF